MFIKVKKTVSTKSFGGYVKPQLLIMAGIMVIKFAGTFAELLLPSLLTHMVDDVAPRKAVGEMFIYGGVMLVCAVIALVCNVAANRSASKVASGITRQLRHDVYKKTISLSCEETDRFTVPTLISRLTSDTYNVHNMLLMVQRIGVRAPILAIGGVIMTATLDPVLTLVLVTLMPIVFISVFIISRIGIRLHTTVQKNSDNMVSMLREHMEGVRVIKALSKTEYEKKRFNEINSGIYRSERKAGMITGLSGPVLNLCLNIGLVAVIVIGAQRVSDNLMKPGVIISFLSYFTIILHSMMMINRIFINLTKGLASAHRINEVLAAPDETECDEEDIKDSDYHISFENVTFSYLKAKSNIENMTFGLKKGQTLGIIGATGSGKTTIVSLLLRFYRADSGAVRINGRNLNSIPRAELYSKFGSALQTDFLMSDTIYENIRFEREVSEELIHDAAVCAMADGFIREKSDGYNHLLNVKAANLSGGQKQRLLITRALAAEPEILIMDDSCGGLDYKTDSLLRQNLRERYSECTKVIVAQRISTVRQSDLIIVMEDGQVAGMGTHDELMASCDIYRETANAQMEIEEKVMSEGGIAQ
ncbi:MAG: ABC transporter ATP-binding protein [Ruminococcaceae bacterium]|nr:ABC transporter ATP-binding protein [Oscillospiraceae bacterium]